MTGNSKSFPDSNVWLYAFSDQDEERKRQAENLNEVCLNLKRKSFFDEAEVRYLISSFYINHEVVELNENFCSRLPN